MDKKSIVTENKLLTRLENNFGKKNIKSVWGDSSVFNFGKTHISWNYNDPGIYQIEIS